MVKNLLPVTSLNMFHFKNSLQCDRLNIFYKLINVKFTTLFPLVPFLSPHNSNLRYTLPVWLDIFMFGCPTCRQPLCQFLDAYLADPVLHRDSSLIERSGILSACVPSCSVYYELFYAGGIM